MSRNMHTGGRGQGSCHNSWKIALLVLALTASSLPLTAQENHGDVSVGYTYLFANQGGGEWVNENGWFARPSYNLPKSYAVFLDFTNYNAANMKGSLNSHAFNAGISKTILRGNVIKPSVFAEGGDLRVSNAGTITNSFQFLTGIGLQLPITKRWSLKLTPAEYILVDSPSGPRNDFNAKTGISLPF
jgi:hypothetical protein